MDIGILVAGDPPGGLSERFGRYDAMVRRLLGDGFEASVYEAALGALPPRPEAHSGYVVTGSPAGVYEPLPWIDPLKAFLRGARGRAKLVGLCFGHQIMAEAYGGRVEKSALGWAAGLQEYELLGRAAFMAADDPATITVPVSHQDQVAEPPPGARVLAQSRFARFGMLSWDGALSMQFHPEFEPDYTAALVECRRDRLPDADSALAALDRPDDRAVAARWIRAFLAK